MHAVRRMGSKTVNPLFMNSEIRVWVGVARGGRESNIYFTEMCSGSETGTYLRLIDFCITQL